MEDAVPFFRQPFVLGERKSSALRICGGFRHVAALSAPKRRQHRLKLIAAMASILILATGGTACALERKVFGTRNACAASGLLTSAECDNAFANAEAELEDSSPHFEKRGECEKFFRRCMIVGFAAKGKGADFAPSMRSVEILVRSPNDKTTRALLEIEHPAISIAPRTLLRPDAHHSPAIRKQSQARWLDAQRPIAPPRESPPLNEAPWRDLPDNPVAAQPEKKQSPNDLEALKRRRDEIKNAPMVY